MPFPVIYGVPRKTRKKRLRRLRKKIVRLLAEFMVIPIDYTHPFFPKDVLRLPKKKSEGGKTIFVCLNTAMFHNKENDMELCRNVIKEVTNLVWNAFDGKYEVEGFIGDLDPDMKCLIKANPKS